MVLWDTQGMMTRELIDFQTLAHWQQSASSNRALVRLLNESAQETLTDKVTPLALAYHQAAVAAAYQHFGFTAFSPEARRLLAMAQSRQSKVSSVSLLEWLDHAAYQQLADFHLLRYLETEPDWLELSQEFCDFVIKRIVACSPEEWYAVGLEHLPSELLNVLESISRRFMAQPPQHKVDQFGSAALQKAQVDDPNLMNTLFPSIDLWGRALDTTLARVAQDPVLLLSWRLEAFTTERQLQCDASLAVSALSQEEIAERSLKVIALIIILSGYDFGGNGAVIPETPLTLSQLMRSLEAFFEAKSEAAAVIESMLKPKHAKGGLKSAIEKQIALGEQLGVFTKVQLSKNQKGILLTSLASRITAPYRELIESTFAG